MIYTVTFSPAIDYVVYMDELRQGATNRTISEEYYFGGKGINVSTILTELGIDNTALGFVSGFTGEALEKGLKEKGIRTDFVHLDNGITRINIKIKMKHEKYYKYFLLMKQKCLKIGTKDIKKIWKK